MSARPIMPADTVQTVNSGLFDLLTLLYATQRSIEEIGDRDLQKDKMHCPTSRTVSLVGLADDKVRELLRTLQPYW